MPEVRHNVQELNHHAPIGIKHLASIVLADRIIPELP
jgi:hypothetical protein